MTGGRSYADRVSRAQVVIGGIAVAVGALGLFLARELGFTDPAGALIGWGDYELKYMAYNPLGALLTVAVGALGVAAGVTRRQALAIVAAAVSALMALQVLVQWRPDGDNLLGGSDKHRTTLFGGRCARETTRTPAANREQHFKVRVLFTQSGD